MDPGYFVPSSMVDGFHGMKVEPNSVRTILFYLHVGNFLLCTVGNVMDPNPNPIEAGCRRNARQKGWNPVIIGLTTACQVNYYSAPVYVR